MEYERYQVENEELKEQHEDIKAKNKMLFEQLTQGGTSASTEGPSGLNDHGSLEAGSDPTGAANIGEIHSLYQDLFLTDIKKEVESAQSELKQCKQEQNTAQREM